LRTSRRLSDSERVAWLRLARAPTVGATTFAALIERYGTPQSALADLPRLMKRGGSDARALPTELDARRELEELAKLGGRILASCEPEFPPGLSALDAPPPILAVLGQRDLLAREMVAIVGARNASALGRKFATTLAQDLSASGFVVVSGMARGIDAAAHEGALGAGTLAVVAGGVDHIYPPEHRALYDRLCEEGVVVSEMPLHHAPQARHFPRRNRIISGLSRGVIVVEAAESSGSLITANYALEQGREVFAVPGSPLDPRAKGANRLIREGATLTETAEDVLAVLRPILGREFAEPEKDRFVPGGRSVDESDVDRCRNAVLEGLGPAPVDIDELVRLANASPAVVQTILLELELAGRITRQAGNRVSWA